MGATSGLVILACQDTFKVIINGVVAGLAKPFQIQDAWLNEVALWVLVPSPEVLVTPVKATLVPLEKFLDGLGLVCEVEVLTEIVPLSGDGDGLPSVST